MKNLESNKNEKLKSTLKTLKQLGISFYTLWGPKLCRFHWERYWWSERNICRYQSVFSSDDVFRCCCSCKLHVTLSLEQNVLKKNRNFYIQNSVFSFCLTSWHSKMISVSGRAVTPWLDCLLGLWCGDASAQSLYFSIWWTRKPVYSYSYLLESEPSLK